MIHELKTWPGFFSALKKGEKTFELRRNDRDFVKGDTLVLKEFHPCETCWGTGKIRDVELYDCGCKKPHGRYTGAVLTYRVTYILKACAGVSPNYVIMGIQKMEKV